MGRRTAEVVASEDVVAQEDCGECHIERMRFLNGCVAIVGKLKSPVTWPRSLFASVDAAGAAEDIHTSSCTPLVQLSLDVNAQNHSGHTLNSLPTFGFPIKGAALCHNIFFWIKLDVLLLLRIVWGLSLGSQALTKVLPHIIASLLVRIAHEQASR